MTVAFVLVTMNNILQLLKPTDSNKVDPLYKHAILHTGISKQIKTVTKKQLKKNQNSRQRIKTQDMITNDI